MPISLELFNFTEQFRIPILKGIAESFVRLGKWLDARLKQAQALDRATADIPIVWIRNQAMSAWIDEKQWRSLTPARPDPGFGAHLSQGAQTMFGALKSAVTGKDADEANILPNFLASMTAGLDRVIASLERFQRPSASMFAFSSRTASDIFGELALTWRALATSRAQLIGENKDKGAGGLVATLSAFLPQGGSKDAAGGVSFGAALDTVGRAIVAALLALPFLPKYIGALWAELSIFVRARTLEIFAGMEASALGLRRTVIDLFYVDLRDALREGLGYAIAGRDMTASFIALFVEATEGWAFEMVEGFRSWFKDLGAFMLGMIDVFHALQSVLDDLMRVDLMQNLDELLSDEWWWRLAKRIATPPSLRIGDLADPQTREAANDRLQSWLSSVRNRAALSVGGPITFGVVEYKVRAVRGILDILLKKDTDEIAETSAFHDLKLSPMPDISDQFTAGLAPFRKALGGMVEALQTRTQAIVDAASGMLDAFGARFDRAAQAALRSPSAARLTAIGANAGALADAAFAPDKGADVDALVGKIARRFDDWLTTPGRARRAGFEIVAAVIPKYVLAMSQYWAELRESEAGKSASPPTSPHILARKQRIAAIRTPQLRIEAKGRRLDDALIAEIVAAFVTGVTDAHRTAIAAGG
ncbi:MAG: hypothetical protein ACLQE9_12425 [Roseiarcus sp.]